MKTMPKKDLDIIFLIDKSGSMYGSEKDTIGGFNSFIDRERKKESNTYITTILFSDKYDVLYKRKDINDVAKLTDREYRVGGTTALLDAIGRTITSMDRETENKVLFVIMTDGYENASIEYSRDQIKKMIANHSWEFIYIGADIDSYREAGNIGIRRSRTANYKKSTRGVENLYRSVECVTKSLRDNVDLDDVDWKKSLREYD